MTVKMQDNQEDLRVEAGMASRRTRRDAVMADLPSATRDDLISLVIEDSLTGAYSREYGLVMMQERVDERAETGVASAILFIDLNGFKQINDVHGHRAGDIVLATFADYVMETIGRDITRLSGDEFALTIAAGWADEIARLIRAFGDIPVTVDRRTGATVTVGCAIGIAPVSGSIVEALASADQAMYADKGSLAR